MKSKIVLFFTIIVCFLMQSTVLHLISIGSITPNLLLILCVSMGLMRGRKSGLWTGFFCGLLVDLFYGSVFGFYALIYMYAGFLSGYAFRIYFKKASSSVTDKSQNSLMLLPPTVTAKYSGFSLAPRQSGQGRSVI